MLLLHLRAALSLTLTFDKLLLLHRQYTALSLKLKLNRLLLLLHVAESCPAGASCMSLTLKLRPQDLP
jgi:hypothetical protein